jgi:hypothetical protein
MLHQNSSYNNTFQQHIQHPHFSCCPTICSLHYFQRLFYQKQLMQPNCPMQLFPTTFLSKTAHAAQLPNAAISNDFSIKNSSCSPTAQCSYFQRLFYQKQLMQPNCPMQLFPTTFLSKTAHAAQLPNAAISNDFSIKNSSCSPTAQCSYFQRLFYQKQLMQPNCPMQLFPAQQYAAQIKNSSCNNPHPRGVSVGCVSFRNGLNN